MESQTASPPGLDRLGFLLARHGRIMNVRTRQALGSAGLSPHHGATLVRLAQAGPTSQQALLDALALDPSALVAVLNDLERDALVQRVRDPHDRRRHIVEITTAGRAAVGRVEEAMAEVEREVCADLDRAEIAQLQTLLSRLRSRPDAACDPSPGTE